MKTLTTVTFILMLWSLLLVGRLTGGEMKWTHFTIAHPLPGEGYGKAGPVMGDFDGDGDLDCALSRRDTHAFYWYERKSDSVWVRHLICDSPDFLQGLGSAPLDVDGDGWIDVVFNQVWFRNPGTLRQHPDTAWEAHVYEQSNHQVHDLMVADINGDGRNDLVTFDGNKLLWYDPSHGLAVTLVAEGLGHHGGVAPKGCGDLDGDGKPDLVVPGFWFKNPGKAGEPWTKHPWPYQPIPRATYGTSIRSWVADLNGDGRNDIVYADCDTGYGHVYFVKNEGGGLQWTRNQLPDPPDEKDVPGTGSWHSLAVADFNADGRPDIFAGEQEDPDDWKNGKLPMKPKGLRPRGVFWLNQGSDKPAFAPHVIHEGNPGWHDVALVDVDGDGDLDLVSAIWKKDGPAYHADFWRNDTERKK